MKYNNLICNFLVQKLQVIAKKFTFSKNKETK